MKTSELDLVPLRQASLCLDCDMITAAHTHCLACGSIALMSLAKTLNGSATLRPAKREMFVVPQNPLRSKHAVPFESAGIREHLGWKNRCAGFRRVLSSFVDRPSGVHLRSIPVTNLSHFE
jgi:hypothetical protein